MTTFYRNRQTGLVQSHPQSGIGKSLNAEEIGEDGKPVKPRTSLAPSKRELKEANELMRDRSATPSKTTGSKTAVGDSNKQKGAK